MGNCKGSGKTGLSPFLCRSFQTWSQRTCEKAYGWGRLQGSDSPTLGRGMIFSRGPYSTNEATKTPDEDRTHVLIFQHLLHLMDKWPLLVDTAMVGGATFQGKSHLVITLVGKSVSSHSMDRRKGIQGLSFWRHFQVAWLWEFTQFQEYVQGCLGGSFG